MGQNKMIVLTPRPLVYLSQKQLQIEAKNELERRQRIEHQQKLAREELLRKQQAKQDLVKQELVKLELTQHKKIKEEVIETPQNTSTTIQKPTQKSPTQNQNSQEKLKLLKPVQTTQNPSPLTSDNSTESIDSGLAKKRRKSHVESFTVSNLLAKSPEKNDFKSPLD